MTRAARQRRRARLAVVACFLWLVGVEVLPALHEAMHESMAPHVHTAGGMTVIVTFGEPTHRHADGTVHAHSASDVEHSAALPPRPARDGRSRVRDRAPDHAAGLAHHAEALLGAKPPLHAPLPVDLKPTLVAIEATAEPAERDPLAPKARGPPSVA